MALSCSAILCGDVEIQVLCDFSKHSSRTVSPLNNDNRVWWKLPWKCKDFDANLNFVILPVLLGW